MVGRCAATHSGTTTTRPGAYIPPVILSGEACAFDRPDGAVPRHFPRPRCGKPRSIAELGCQALGVTRYPCCRNRNVHRRTIGGLHYTPPQCRHNEEAGRLCGTRRATYQLRRSLGSHSKSDRVGAHSRKCCCNKMLRLLAAYCGRHTPCAVTLIAHAVRDLRERHTACAYYNAPACPEAAGGRIGGSGRDVGSSCILPLSQPNSRIIDSWWTKFGLTPCGRRALARRDPISVGYFFCAGGERERLVADRPAVLPDCDRARPDRPLTAFQG